MSTPTIYQFKITLQGSEPPIWRRVQMPAESSLADLHDVVQICMEWEDDHMHQFLAGMQCYGPTDIDGVFDTDVEMEDETAVLLGEVFPRKGSKIIYEYDFGDSWEHEIVLEEKLAANPNIAYPVCVAGQRSGPPEDCGGIMGYVHLLEVLKDPKNPEYEDAVEWLGTSEYDAEFFDPEETNQRLADFGDPDDDSGEMAREAIMEIIETQIENDDPPETRQTLERLIAAGMPEQEAWNLVASALSEEIYKVLREQQQFDRVSYIQALKALPRLPWAEPPV